MSVIAHQQHPLTARAEDEIRLDPVEASTDALNSSTSSPGPDNGRVTGSAYSLLSPMVINLLLWARDRSRESIGPAANLWAPENLRTAARATLGLTGFVVACVALWSTVSATRDGHKSAILQEWSTKKDYLEFCKADGFASAGCESVRNTTLEPPPIFDRRDVSYTDYPVPAPSSSVLAALLSVILCCSWAGCGRRVRGRRLLRYLSSLRPGTWKERNPLREPSWPQAVVVPFTPRSTPQPPSAATHTGSESSTTTDLKLRTSTARPRYRRPLRPLQAMQKLSCGYKPLRDFRPESATSISVVEAREGDEADAPYKCHEKGCGGHFQTEYEKTRHKFFVHQTPFRWTCSALASSLDAFFCIDEGPGLGRSPTDDICGFCGRYFHRSGHPSPTTEDSMPGRNTVTESDEKERHLHLSEAHNFQHCSSPLDAFPGAASFRYHLKVEHGAVVDGNWTDWIETACIQEVQGDRCEK
ncbi:hypothetical protein QBC34DRAFT_175348 [Podospora aff. communis PSN243]|uniref:C2H2-type domain-containing protein n=1 Tax=Podospora aff. communis PSN243 TaxID=3040156 RepID=A0AAV9GYE8_9PEZI|nr:hypothetical protein QBC34DRAFT_175348 [Podospora aff. communis PSN243]